MDSKGPGSINGQLAVFVVWSLLCMMTGGALTWLAMTRWF